MKNCQRNSLGNEKNVVQIDKNRRRDDKSQYDTKWRSFYRLYKGNVYHKVIKGDCIEQEEITKGTEKNGKLQQDVKTGKALLRIIGFKSACLFCIALSHTDAALWHERKPSSKGSEYSGNIA